jgi:hypothetical protein
MNTSVMLTKLLPGALATPNAAETLNREVNDRIKRQCSGVKWLANYAISGHYLDVFEAAGGDIAAKVALLISSFGRTTAELWTATPWDHFMGMTGRLDSQSSCDGYSSAAPKKNKRTGDRPTQNVER